VKSEGADLTRRIEIIESSYEYLLAYAAQGRLDDRGTEARPRLAAMHEALDGLAAEARDVLESSGAADGGRGSVHDIGAFLEALQRDAAAARGAIALVLRKAAIPSLLVDNLNASVHLRALLTDAFLVEQSLKQGAPAP
jgi:hypothetical protein